MCVPLIGDCHAMQSILGFVGAWTRTRMPRILQLWLTPLLRLRARVVVLQRGARRGWLPRRHAVCTPVCGLCAFVELACVRLGARGSVRGRLASKTK